MEKFGPETIFMDATGWSNTWSILQIRKRLKSLGPEEALEILTADPGLAQKLRPLITDTGRRIEKIWKLEGGFRFRVENIEGRHEHES